MNVRRWAVLAGLIAIAGCTKSSETHRRTDAQTDPVQDFQTLTEQGFELRAPRTWTRKSQPGVAVTLVSPVAFGDAFLTNVNVVIEPFAADVHALVDENAKTIADRGGRVGERRPARVGEVEAIDLETRWPTMRPPVRTIQRYAVNRGKAYVVGCTMALEGAEASVSVCTAILASFRFVP